MSEIIIPKKWVIAVLTLIGLSAGLIWAVPQMIGRSQAEDLITSSVNISQNVNPEDADDQARKAAVAGTQAFYTVDYQKGQQDWLDRLCSVSTKAGCIFDQNVIGPNLWIGFEQSLTVTSVKVTAQEKVDEQIAASRGDAPVQVWLLQIELSDPWPIQKKPETVFTALTLIVLEQDGWKFERFLTEEELSAASNQGGQP